MNTGTGNYLMVSTLTQGSLKNHARGEKRRGKQPKAAANDRRSKPSPFTPWQLRRMEELFRELTYPETHVRSALAKELGLTVRRVKHWFQNRRQQLKVKMEKEERRVLLEEKNMLMMENSYLKGVASNLTCTSCPGVSQPLSPDAQRLQIENALLKEELARLRGSLNSMGFVPENPPVLSSWNSFSGNYNGYHQGEELLNNQLESYGPRGLMNSSELMAENPSATSALGSFASSSIYQQGDESLNKHWESSGPRGLMNSMEFLPENPSDNENIGLFCRQLYLSPGWKPLRRNPKFWITGRI